MEQFTFGQLPDGRSVTAWRLCSADGISAVILDYGCTVQSLLVPGRSGSPVNVVLGYDTAAEYVQNGGFFGACIGRVGNRIGGGMLTIDGKTWCLPRNEGQNHLHGGPEGFDRQIWHGEARDGKLVFTRTSPDGEAGYPGRLEVRVIYSLEGNALCIDYEATADAPTAVNLTNHSYFNLSGAGDILGHILRLEADSFTEIDEALLPTGRILPVAGTPMDFTREKPIGQDINAVYSQLQLAGGYDHNYVLRCGSPAARLYSPDSGIAMTVSTTKPAVQLYSGNSITPRRGRDGVMLTKHSGICLETQIHPDAIHHSAFPSPILRPGERYCHQTVYAFSVE